MWIGRGEEAAGDATAAVYQQETDPEWRESSHEWIQRLCTPRDKQHVRSFEPELPFFPETGREVARFRSTADVTVSPEFARSLGEACVSQLV